MTWFDLVDLIDFFKQWGRLIVISFLAATVQMYVSGKKYSFFHHFMGVLVAILAAYMASAFCNWREFDDDLTTGVIAVFAYSAPHILEGINKLAQSFSNNPSELIAILFKAKK